MRLGFVAALACAVPLLLARPGLAQSAADTERAKASFKAGANAYAAGDYLAAIQALETAYELSPLPAIAFSLAQAERKQYFVKQDREHLERALLLFRRYVEQAPRGPRREDALSAIASRPSDTISCCSSNRFELTSVWTQYVPADGNVTFTKKLMLSANPPGAISKLVG